MRTAMRILLTLVTVAIVALASHPALADQGGYVDPNTGKVWSPSILQISGSLSTIAWASNYAANYSVVDNNIVYSDWRLPTVSELQAAVADGTIQTVNLASGHPLTNSPNSFRLFWTSESRGNKQWVVKVIFDNSQGYVLGGGEAVLVLKTSALDAFMIRP